MLCFEGQFSLISIFSSSNCYNVIVYRVGIELPTIEVKFEHMTVEADINTGSRALPSFINFYIVIFEVKNTISKCI